MIRRILLSWWIPVTLLVAAESLVVAYVAEAGQPSWATGALLATFPAGSALGSLVVGRWCGPARCVRLAPWLLALVGTGLLPIALHPPVAVSALCLFAASVGTAYELGGQRAFITAVPVDRQGLALGLVSTGIMTGQGVGPVVAGAVAQAVGVGLTISLLGVSIVLTTFWLGRFPGTAIDPDVSQPG
jgi:MFS family permease